MRCIFRFHFYSFDFVANSAYNKMLGKHSKGRSTEVSGSITKM